MVTPPIPTLDDVAAAKASFARLTRVEARAWAVAYLRREMEAGATLEQIRATRDLSRHYWREPGMNLVAGSIRIYTSYPHEAHRFTVAELTPDLLGQVHLLDLIDPPRSLEEMQWRREP